MEYLARIFVCVVEAHDPGFTPPYSFRRPRDRAVHGAAHPGRPQGLPERAPVHVRGQVFSRESDCRCPPISLLITL